MPPNNPAAYFGRQRGRFSVPETVNPDFDPSDQYGIGSINVPEYRDPAALGRGMTGNITNLDRKRMIEQAQARGQEIAGGLSQYDDLLLPGSDVNLGEVTPPGMPANPSIADTSAIDQYVDPTITETIIGGPPQRVSEIGSDPGGGEPVTAPPPKPAPPSIYDRVIDPTVQAISGVVGDIGLPTWKGIGEQLTPGSKAPEGSGKALVDVLLGRTGAGIGPTVNQIAGAIPKLGGPNIDQIIRALGLNRPRRTVDTDRGTEESVNLP